MALTTTSPPFLATRRGKLTLALLCAIAFLDFVDASIVNIALPSIRRALHFSEGDLQWVPSGSLLTYGGFMLLGGRAADLLGRRRVLVAGVVVIGLSSLFGGFAGSSGALIGARFAQGLGAAMTLPAALSLITTSFKEGKDRNTALGAWGGAAAMASAAGVLLGGLLTAGPGWRWVMFVNPIACALVLWPIFRLIKGDRPRARLQNFDALGAVLATGGMLLLVYALVKAPHVGWGAGRTFGELAGALGLLVAFVVNEQRNSNPLMPLSIFRVKGLAAADATQLVAVAGFLAMFFYLNLYMQNILGYSALQTGALYLPLTFAIGIAAGITPQLVSRVGTRPVIVSGAAIAAGGLYWLFRVRRAPGHARVLAWCRPAVRRRHHRRQCRRARRQGRACRVAAQRLAAARRRARTGDLYRGRDEPHQRPVGCARASGAGLDRRLPARVSRRQHPRRHRRPHRASRDEHPRRDGGGCRGGATRAGRVMSRTPHNRCGRSGRRALLPELVTSCRTPCGDPAAPPRSASGRRSPGVVRNETH